METIENLKKILFFQVSINTIRKLIIDLHWFSVCEKAKYGWDDNGIYYNVADRN